jgi:hypothetical protein
MFPYTRSTAKFCSGTCRKAFFDAQAPKQYESGALLSVRARQQKKEIERAQVAARKHERASKKARRDKLKAENVRLGVEQALAIEASNREIAERAEQQARMDLSNGVLAINIAAQDKQHPQEGL